MRTGEKLRLVANMVLCGSDRKEMEKGEQRSSS